MKRWLLLLALLLLATGAGAERVPRREVPPAPGPLVNHTLYAKSHALLIGISRYQHLPAESRLQFAHRDALDLRDLLIKSYGFPAENVTLLLNEQATKAAIEKALSSYADSGRVGKEDRLLLFFSGHGQTVTLPDGSEMGFLVPHDARIDLTHPDNAGPYLDTCVEMDGVWKYLRACPAKHALLLADACFSGLLTQPRGLTDLPKLSAAELLKHATRPARQVLTAGGKGELTFEAAALGHGVFTYKLLEELRAQAAAEGEVFTASDLAAQLKRSVAKLSGGKQNPVFGSYRTEGEFLFATTAPSQVPPVTAAVTAPGPAIADGAPRELAALVNSVGKISRSTQRLDRSDGEGFTLHITGDPTPGLPSNYEFQVRYEDVDLSPRLQSIAMAVTLHPRPGRNFTFRNLDTGATKSRDSVSLLFRTEAESFLCIELIRRSAGYPSLVQPILGMTQAEREFAGFRLRDWVNAHAHGMATRSGGTTESFTCEMTALTTEGFRLRNTRLETEGGVPMTTVTQYEVRFADLNLELIGFYEGSITVVNLPPQSGQRFIRGKRQSFNPLIIPAPFFFAKAEEAETFLILLLQATGHRLAIPLQNAPR